ncbi:AfsR/SARP family transcriptional regulator [Kitasatospora sp. NPDC004272]
MGTDFQFCLLGPVVARRNGLTTPIGPPQRRALLAVLLLARSQAVPVALIRERLWPTGAPATAIDAIQVHVHHLRRCLQENAAAIRPAPDLTGYPGHSREQASYALHIGTHAVDILVFEQMATRGRELEKGGRYEEALLTYIAAQHSWRGQPLSDLRPTPYITTARQGLLDIRQDVRTRAARMRLRLGAVAEAADELRQLHQEYPGDVGIVLLRSRALFMSDAPRRALELLDDEVRNWQQQYARTPEQLLRQREQVLLGSLEQMW